MKAKKRMLSLLLAVCLVAGILPTTALAADHVHDDTCGYADPVPCGHTTHDDTCGYAEAVTGADCTHEHGDDCSYVAAVEGAECTHEHGDCGYEAAAPATPCTHDCNAEGTSCTESNCVHTEHDGYCGYFEGTPESPCEHSHDGTCGYVEAVAGVDCNHQHNDACGYADAVAGAECTHTCTEGGDCGYSAGSACTYVAEPIQDGDTDPATTYYTITYTDGVGGTVFTDQVYTVAAGGSFPYFDTTTGSLEREGYSFNGWTPTLETTVTKDVTYTAVWNVFIETGYTITYTDGVDGEEIFADQVYNNVESGTNTPAFEGTPARTGFTFAGWNPTVTATVTGNATYTAQWTEDAPSHTHSYTKNYNDTHHWDECSCGDKGDEIEHIYSAATCSTPATCSCGATTGSVDSTNHTGGTEVRNASSATATQNGYTGDTYCLGCDTIIVTGTTIPATGGGSSYDDDDVVYTPPIPTDTLQNENGDTVTTAEPSTVVRRDTATTTITVTDGNRLVNEVVRNGSDQLVIAPKIGQDVSGVEVSIPATVVKQLAERTDADLQIATGVAEVNIGSAELDGHSGSLVMEAQRTEDGISTKVTIGGVTVIDTGVKLPVGVTLPEDEKLVVGTLQPSMNDLNFLPLTETTAPSTRVAVVTEDKIVSMAAAVIGSDGESYTQHERLLINGKEYYVSGSGDGESLSLYDKEGNIYSYDGEKDPQAIGQDAGTEYPENEFISINGAVYQVHSVQRDTDGNGTLILYLDGNPAGMCQFNQYEEMNSINIYNEDYAPDKVKERQQNSNYLGTVTTGETPIDGLESGKTYNVSVIGAQDISVPGYDEALLNSIKTETEEEKAAREEVERLKADMEAKKAAVDQLDATDPDHMKAWAAWDEAEAAYKAALAELAALANLQSATVTQKFQIPDALVGRNNVKFVAVHDINPHATALAAAKFKMEEARWVYWEYHGDSSEERQRLYEAANRAEMEWAIVQEHYDAWEKEHATDAETGNELGTVTIAEDGKTLTAAYTVNSFSPFTIYAFVEADEPKIKEITTNNTPADGGEDVPASPDTGDDTPALPVDDKKTLVYLVKQGDTLWAISRRYGCTVAEIVALNGELITDPDLIFAGWELKIPQD